MSDQNPPENVRLRLDISYDGTDFSGWAAQPDRRTVAGCLSEALKVLFRQDVPLVVAGRTDAGVHATGQVAHIDVPVAGLIGLAPRAKDPETDGLTGGRTGLLRRLAGLLPLDIRVRAVTVAPDGFDARFAALRRHYRYRIGTAEWGVEPLGRKDVFARRRPLDVDAMTKAADLLVGLHDFASFCKPRDGATTVRELQSLTVGRQGDLVVVEVTADAFCHSMVRSLVGALIAVGEHQVPFTRPAEQLAAASRSSGVNIAPALGLTLTSVDYPADEQLRSRALATRATRELPPRLEPIDHGNGHSGTEAS
ncbi:tRNA pseudouridine38-40 synthase [Nakamurella panacisegetis]|uniref:tRNA pseudouridine synthase A n=1 Tax=Nakamurella panacisegetis TaxID=1090615 RepID=A0A1H0P1B8_9ACTN|nr:tRNA pseudouridine(38-40) synthase TruA [Nakamurella panacisegetis]SDO98857.1 tRNA pseudouridine38-40 synthase [Nakamurella panacisegetis]